MAKKSSCITCHEEITPNIVKDFLSGAMGQSGLDCSACHGKGHQGKDDLDKVKLPTEKTCHPCHMADGNHAVIPSWGFLAVRLPEDDKEWMG